MEAPFEGFDGSNIDIAWKALFDVESLARFTPETGDDGFAPILEVYYLTTEGVGEVAAFLLAGIDFNDRETRYHAMNVMGGKFAELGWRVYGLILAAEAWARSVSTDEFTAGVRPVSEYDDKKEIMSVAGMAIDGRISMASADMYRNSDNEIEGLGAWIVRHEGRDSKAKSHLLNEVYVAYINALRARRFGSN